MRSIRVLVLLVAVAAMGAGCGYSLAGRGSFLPTYIKTIGVPEFGNATPYLEVQRRFTDRVRSELIGRGRYKVLPSETGVDAVLRGTITSLSLVPANFNASQQATRYVVIVVTKLELVDLTTNKILLENPGATFREEYDLPPSSEAGNPEAFFGGSSNALERVANEFARSVVSAILEAF